MLTMVFSTTYATAKCFKMIGCLRKTKMHYNLSFFMIWWKSAILLVVMQVSKKLICSIILWETLTPRYDPNAVQLDC